VRIGCNQILPVQQPAGSATSTKRGQDPMEVILMKQRECFTLDEKQKDKTFSCKNVTV
jgi:hypothetical protein